MKNAGGLSTAELIDIGTTLYRGVTYKGRPAWQSWLEDGLGIGSVTVRRWLMEDAASRRAASGPAAALLVAASRIAGELEMWDQPRGTLIVDRMAALVKRNPPG